MTRCQHAVWRSTGISGAALVAALTVHAASIQLLVNSSTGQSVRRPSTVDVVLNVGRVDADPAAQGGVDPQPNRQLSAERHRTSTHRKIHEESDGLVIAQPAGPHYFRLSELTQHPSIKQDVLTGLVMHHPGLPPQPVILRLLISDEGTVDRVLVEDSYVGPDIERQVNEALSRVVFEPGKIGRIAVRSQFRVEARLEPTVNAFPPGPATIE